MAGPYFGERPNFDVAVIELGKCHDAIKYGTYGRFRWNTEDREETVELCAEILELYGIEVDRTVLERRFEEERDEEETIDRLDEVEPEDL